MPVMINARASMMEMVEVEVVDVGGRMRIQRQRADLFRTVQPIHHPSAASR